MRAKFAEMAKTGYNLVNNNCATTVIDVLKSGGIKVPNLNRVRIQVSIEILDNIYVFSVSLALTQNILPIQAFESIQEYNKGGNLYKRTK